LQKNLLGLPHGIAFFGGLVTVGRDEKMKCWVIEPPAPITQRVYRCDKRFHIGELENMLTEHEHAFGFIVIDGNGCLYGILSGSSREVLHKFTVDLPKKHGRGGQSALRFARLRTEKRHNYIRKCAELAVQFFITDDRPNVNGLVLAGSADFKTELAQSDLFDQRLTVKIVKIVDVSYGGENGFNQAIELAADALAGVKFVQEKKLISKFFEEIGQDTGRYCFGVDETMKGLEMGAVETLIVWEGFETLRVPMINRTTDVTRIVHLANQEGLAQEFTDPETGEILEPGEPILFLEWIANEYKVFGTSLEIVTNKSQEGSQFVKGFGGLGGMLRYAVNFMELEGEDGQVD